MKSNSQKGLRMAHSPLLSLPAANNTIRSETFGMKGAYETAYRNWLRDPEGFWAEAAEAIHWYRRWDHILDASRAPFYRWFSGGLVNTCYNLLDVHVENGRGEQLALIYDSPVTNTVKSYTYRELLQEVAMFAGALQQHGVGAGDRVIIYMPMVPETVI